MTYSNAIAMEYQNFMIPADQLPKLHDALYNSLSNWLKFKVGADLGDSGKNSEDLDDNTHRVLSPDKQSSVLIRGRCASMRIRQFAQDVTIAIHSMFKRIE